MNDTELKCFIAVADTLSFTKAAERMYFSVATVTHHIQVLERELDTQLFIRTKKQVALTDAGKIFYISAKQLLTQERLAINNLKELREGRILRIGCTSNSEAFRLIPLLKKLKTAYHNIIPEIHVEDYNAILRDLEMESIDFALGSKAMARNTGLQYTELCYLRIYASFNVDNPLSRRKSICFDELRDHTLLMLSEKMVPFDEDSPIGDLFAAHATMHHDKVIDLEADAFPLVIAGYGGFIIPAYRVPPHIKELGIVIVPVEEFPLFSYGLIHKKCRDRELWNYIVNGCREICSSVYTAMPGIPSE